jgi:hypothetical protein
MKYYISYCLGLKEPSNLKAAKGNVTHKALELFARKKKCHQDKALTYEDDNFGIVRATDINLEWAVNKAYKYYSELENHHTWTKKDYKDCFVWTEKCLTMNNGLFNPMNRKIIEPEQRFDFEIKKPWAAYDYNLPDGTNFSGFLSIKGTMDLVVDEGEGLIEVIDYKTGRRLDWATGEEKTYKKLRYDPQLLLYHYATALLYPKADEIFITIIYINDGGPFTFCFERKDFELTERLLRAKFESIRDTQRPQLKKSWKCTKLCMFGKEKHPLDTSKTICEFIKDETRKKGADAVLCEYGDVSKVNTYQDGGGRQAETGKELK